MRKDLTKKADIVFSRYVRNRGETFGYNHCYTCGAYVPVGDLQAGHFIPRRYLNTRWHPLNVWPSCNRCNVELSGNLDVYERKLIANYGKDAVDGLKDLAHSLNKVTDSDIKEIIRLYNHKLSML